MATFKRKKILKEMKFQMPQFHKQYVKGQLLNIFGSGFIIFGSTYLVAFVSVKSIMLDGGSWWRHPDALIAIPIVAATMVGGGATMVVFGQKNKRKAINSFAENVYNGKAYLPQKKIQTELNFNFSSNRIGFLVNF